MLKSIVTKLTVKNMLKSIITKLTVKKHVKITYEIKKTKLICKNELKWTDYFQRERKKENKTKYTDLVNLVSGQS